MNIIDLIKNFRNVTNFSSRPVDREKIDRVVKAVHFSPVGTDKIPLKTIVISESETKHKLRQAAENIERAYQQGTDNGNNSSNSDWQKPFLEEAPYLVVICSLSGQPYQAATTWLTLGNLMMAAANEGLGSLCYAPSMPTFLRKVLDISAKYMPIAIVPVGYSAEDLFPRHNPAEEKMFRNLFSGRFNWQKQ